MTDRFLKMIEIVIQRLMFAWLKGVNAGTVGKSEKQDTCKDNIKTTLST